MCDLYVCFLSRGGSLVGILTVVSTHVANKVNLSLVLTFASGALLTTAVIHVIPEAMTGLLASFENDMEDMFTRAGIVVMSGIFVGFLMHVWLDEGHDHSHGSGPHGDPAGVGSGPHHEQDALTRPGAGKLGQQQTKAIGAPTPAAPIAGDSSTAVRAVVVASGSSTNRADIEAGTENVPVPDRTGGPNTAVGAVVVDAATSGTVVEKPAVNGSCEQEGGVGGRNNSSHGVPNGTATAAKAAVWGSGDGCAEASTASSSSCKSTQPKELASRARGGRGLSLIHI